VNIGSTIWLINVKSWLFYITCDYHVSSPAFQRPLYSFVLILWQNKFDRAFKCSNECLNECKTKGCYSQEVANNLTEMQIGQFHQLSYV
jgi:hypothetical protein